MMFLYITAARRPTRRVVEGAIDWKILRRNQNIMDMGEVRQS